MSSLHRAFLVLVTVAIGILLVVMAMLQTGLPVWPAREKSAPFQAKVVRFGDLPNPRWTSDKLIIVAATADGRTGQGVITIAQRDETGCKVGSPVSAHMEGSMTVVDAASCNQSLH